MSILCKFTRNSNLGSFAVFVLKMLFFTFCSSCIRRVMINERIHKRSAALGWAMLSMGHKTLIKLPTASIDTMYVINYLT
jgi:hypothetical protein